MNEQLSFLLHMSPDADQKGLMDAMLESLKSGSAFGNRQNSRRKRKNRKEEKEEEEAQPSMILPFPLCFVSFLTDHNFGTRCQCLGFACPANDRLWRISAVQCEFTFLFCLEVLRKKERRKKNFVGLFFIAPCILFYCFFGFPFPPTRRKQAHQRKEKRKKEKRKEPQNPVEDEKETEKKERERKSRRRESEKVIV